jgi:hypothetical protein
MTISRAMRHMSPSVTTSERLYVLTFTYPASVGSEDFFVAPSTSIPQDTYLSDDLESPGVCESLETILMRWRFIRERWLGPDSYSPPRDPYEIMTYETALVRQIMRL